jgi:preprotein translocase subunit SecF
MSTLVDARPPSAPKRNGLWHRLYHGETAYDFVGRRKIGFAISGVLILVTLISLFARGLNYGLDFKGGVVWEPPAKNGLTIDGVKSVLSANGVKDEDAKFQELTGASGKRIRVQTGALPADERTKIATALAEKAGVPVDQVPFSSVSATWGSQIRNKAIEALLVFFVALTAYIWFRFKTWRMAAAAVVAVIHDVLISVGVYSVLGLPVTPATVIAFLTILGFSLYDTIVVFDKVNENTRKMSSGLSYTDVVNLSMNQTLMRSINTSLAAVLPVLSLLVVGAGIMGAVALKEFALALFVGLLAGSYSSIFIASPLLALLERYGKKGKDRLRMASGRLEPRKAVRSETQLVDTISGVSPSINSDIASDAAKVVAGARSVASGAPSIDAPSAGLTHAPRPRKKKRR